MYHVRVRHWAVSTQPPRPDRPLTVGLGVVLEEGKECAGKQSMACCLSENPDTPSWEKGSSLQAPSWVEKRRRRLQQHEMRLRPWVSCSQPASSQQASSQQLPASPPACHPSRIRGLQRAVEPPPTCGLCGRELLQQQQQQQPPVTPSRPDPFFALQCTKADNLWSVCVGGTPDKAVQPRYYPRGSTTGE